MKRDVWQYIWDELGADTEKKRLDMLERTIIRILLSIGRGKTGREFLQELKKRARSEEGFQSCLADLEVYKNLGYLNGDYSRTPLGEEYLPE